MGIKSKNEKRTVFERESKTGKKHLVVRQNNKKMAPGEAADKAIERASKRLDRKLKKIDKELGL
jgi:hypothetical protein